LKEDPNAGFIYAGTSSGWLEGKAKTPAGKAEQVRPRRSASDEEVHQPLAESLARKSTAVY